jgi:hypothetical protein
MPQGPASGRVRIALTGTPRSGNSWLRLLLSGIYACESLASHSPEEVPWNALPEDIVLQMHAHADAELKATLQGHGFRVLALARHPLDVLLSILHYVRRDSSPARWLAEERGEEVAIAGCNPLEPAFLRYATGARAQTLLGLSREWWALPDVFRLRYEDLCADTAGALEPLIARISPPRAVVEDVVAAHTLGELRRSISRHHFWQGRPGHWRALLPVDRAKRIAEAHQDSFDLFAYELDPDSELDATTALRNWERIASSPSNAAVDGLEAARATDAREILGLRAERYALLAELGKERTARHGSEAEADRLRDQVAALGESLERLQAEHVDSVRRREASEHEAESLRAEVQWRESIQTRLEDELEWRKQTADHLAEELDSARVRAEAADAAATALLASRSFRYTAPFRSIGRLFRGLTHRVG